MSVILSLLAEFWPYVAGAVSALIAFLAGRRSQRQKDRIKGLERKIEREEIEDEIDNLTPADRDKRLDKWMRD